MFQYIELVKEYSKRRYIAHAAMEIQKSVEEGMPSEELMQLAQEKLLSICAESGSKLIHLRDLLEEIYEQINTGKVLDPVAHYGFLDVDKRTHGMHSGELIMVAARTSVGKTAFAVNVAKNVSYYEGKAVFIASLEQSGLELAQRFLAQQARIHAQRIRNGSLVGEEYTVASEAIEVLQKAEVLIDETANQDIYKIITNARRCKQTHDISLVVVDYLQLVDASKGKSRVEEVGEVSRRLKQLAKELEIPVMALAQLNRQAENREKPKLADLRESGSLEQDSDTVILLSRSGGMQGKVQPILVDVAKQRHGPIGEEMLAYTGEHYIFENYSSENW